MKKESTGTDNQKDTGSKSDSEIREGRKSLTMPVGKGAKNKVRYIEGTQKLKDGCWLSDN